MKVKLVQPNWGTFEPKWNQRVGKYVVHNFIVLEKFDTLNPCGGGEIGEPVEIGLRE
jgi:hypothetical protein